MGMRAAKPMREDAILGDAVQDAVRAHDCGIDRSGQHQDADEHDKPLEGQLQIEWANKIQCQTANEIPEILGPNCIRNDHGGEK